MVWFVCGISCLDDQGVKERIRVDALYRFKELFLSVGYFEWLHLILAEHLHRFFRSDAAFIQVFQDFTPVFFGEHNQIFPAGFVP